MHRRRVWLCAMAGCLTGAAALAWAARSQPHAFSLASDVTIPFELANRHIMLVVTVDDSRALAFVLDTGDKYAIIDLDLANTLGLRLGSRLPVRGASSQSATGAFLLGSPMFRVAGLPGFSQPVTLAIPLRSLASRFGRDFDGILGADFIQEFVVEVDYPSRTITLHDSSTFTYTGRGDNLPITLNAAGHPIVAASVTPMGADPIAGQFVIDLGASGTLTLHSPFVSEHHLPGPTLPTIKGMGVGGVGGDASGRIGRVSALTMGHVTLGNPTAFFSEDTSGANANGATAGSIGAQMMSRFRVFLDYRHGRLILEPNATVADPFAPASSGLAIEAEGRDYKTFRVKDVLEHSPGSDAGLRANDIITSIDARSASSLTLSDVLDLFERPVVYTVRVRRDEQTLTVRLAPRRLV